MLVRSLYCIASRVRPGEAHFKSVPIYNVYNVYNSFPRTVVFKGARSFTSSVEIDSIDSIPKKKPKRLVWKSPTVLGIVQKLLAFRPAVSHDYEKNVSFGTSGLHYGAMPPIWYQILKPVSGLASDYSFRELGRTDILKIAGYLKTTLHRNKFESLLKEAAVDFSEEIETAARDFSFSLQLNTNLIVRTNIIPSELKGQNNRIRRSSSGRFVGAIVDPVLLSGVYHLAQERKKLGLSKVRKSHLKKGCGGFDSAVLYRVLLKLRRMSEKKLKSPEFLSDILPLEDKRVLNLLRSFQEGLI
jgi:hypothetical protein